MSKFCQNCGAEQSLTNSICSECGKPPFVVFNEKDNYELDIAVKVVSFCIPLVGGILYFVHKNSAPQKSKDACSAALWGMLVNFILQIIATVSGA